jgi:hypothetical protein
MAFKTKTKSHALSEGKEEQVYLNKRGIGIGAARSTRLPDTRRYVFEDH